MSRRSLRRLAPASSLAPPAVPVVLPSLAASSLVPDQYHGAAILAGVAAGAFLIMILAWTMMRRLSRPPKPSASPTSPDLSALRSIPLDGDGIDAALEPSEVPQVNSNPASPKVDQAGIPQPPILPTRTVGTPPPGPSSAPKLRLGATMPHAASKAPASATPISIPPSTPSPIQTAGPSIKLSPSTGPRLHGRTTAPTPKPASASAQEPTPPTPTKPVSLHERIQAIDVEQMVAVMRAVFERQGYHPLSDGDPNRQLERDFALEKDGEVTLVSCRPAAEPRVGLQGVQEFADRMGSAGIAKGLLLAVKGYTFEARGGASSRGITILDGPEVLRLLESVQAGSDPELSRALSGPTVPTPPVPGSAALKLAKHD